MININNNYPELIKLKILPLTLMCGETIPNGKNIVIPIEKH